jgi:pimeloyl-ACP methyl ester carboxylesterase
MRTIRCLAATAMLGLSAVSIAATAEKVVDIPSRPGVTLRMLVLVPTEPRAAVVLLPGGHGGLQIYPNGSMKWGDGNFLVRSRRLFADQGLLVVVLDAPSDRQSFPYLSGFRQTPQHVADLKAAIAWAREGFKVHIWLVGTSRGTQSAAYAATELLGPDGPDGLVLTSSILTDDKSRPVPSMPIEKIRVPVLVVHHEQDGCSLCSFSNIPALMAKLKNSSHSEVLSFRGGQNSGDPCEAFAYHGFNGIEPEVVRQVATWVLAK